MTLEQAKTIYAAYDWERPLTDSEREAERIVMAHERQERRAAAVAWLRDPIFPLR